MNTVVGAAGRWALIALWLALMAAGCGTSVSGPDVDVDGSARDGAEQEGATTADVASDAPINPSMDASADAGGNEACDRPTPVSPGTMLTNVSTAGASVSTVACLPAFRGPLRFYSIDVPAGQVLEVTASAVDSMLPVAIRVFESCDGACVNAAPSSVQWHNRSLSPRAVIVAIGGQGAEPITFNAVFSTRNTVPGDTCAAPIDVSSSMAIRVEGVPESARALLCDGETSRVRWFRVRVAAGLELNARAVGSDAQLRLSDDCSSMTCLASAARSVTLARAMTDRTVMLAVSPPDGAGFSVEIDLTPVPVPGMCSASAVYRTSTMLNGESITRAVEPAPNCSGTSNPAVFYRVVLGAGQRLTATHSSFDMIMRILSSCGAAACLVAPGGPSSAQRVRYVNESGAEQTVVVAVSQRFPSPNTTYNLGLTIDTPPPAASCATAPSVIPGSTVTISSDEATTVAARCGSSATVRSLFYSVDVPAGRRVVVTGHRDTVVSILDACGSSTCLGARWSNDGSSSSTSAAWTNSGAGSRRVIVTLSHYFESSFAATIGANFSLDMLAPQGTCATAPTLNSGDTVAGASTQMSDQTFTPCEGSSSTQPALWWRVTVPAGQRAVATLQTASSFAAHGLAFVSACGAVSCLASVPLFSSGSSSPRALGWTNATSDARTVYLVAYGAVAPFDLSLNVAPPLANAACAGSMTLEPGVVRAGQRFVHAGEAATSCTSAPAAAALYYNVTVPAGQRLDVTVISAGANHLTRILPSCGAVSCFATSMSSGTTSVTRWTNTDSTARSVIVAVSRAEYSTGSSGAFDITASFVTPPTFARCASPSPLMPGITVSGSTDNVGDLSTTCSGSTSRALYYSVRVPAGQRVVVRVTSGSFDGAYTRILSSCDAVTCLAATSFDNVAYWSNTSVAAQDVIVAVGPRSTTSTGGAFTLTATLETPATNGRCSTPTVVNAPATLMGERFIDAVDMTAGCSTPRASLFYAVTVPANRRLFVRTSSRTGTSSITSIQASCGGACLSLGDSFRAATQWTNVTASPVTVIVAVAAFSASSIVTATADIEFAIQAIPEGGACAAAPALTPGVAQTIAWPDVSEAALTCGATATTLPSLFYSITVPAGQTLTATVSGPSLFYAGIRILSGCAAPSCLSGWRQSLSPLTTSWRNTGASPATVIVALGSTDTSGAMAPSLLTVALTP